MVALLLAGFALAVTEHTEYDDTSLRAQIEKTALSVGRLHPRYQADANLVGIEALRTPRSTPVVFLNNQGNMGRYLADKQ